jgi:alkylation response protein AidB-like acyl-CoA dehydrogenase
MTGGLLDPPELGDYRAQARAWLRANLDRRAELGQRGETAEDPYSDQHIAAHRQIQRRLSDGGYAGISWPAEYGGGGLSAAHARAFAEEAAPFQTPDFGILSVTTFGSCVPTMLRHASPAFLEQHVPPVLRGEQLWCQFFSEPAAGSDLAGVRTRATRQGGGWVLNGAKTWSSYAHLADWGMCLARTNWDVPKHRGLTWFAVPLSAAGLTVRPIRQMTGKSGFCEEFLDDVAIPDTERIGEVDSGWSVTSTLLYLERGAGRPEATEEPDNPGPLCPDLVAIARRAGRLGEPGVRRRLVSAFIDEYAAEQLKGRIAAAARAGSVDPGTASYGKLATSRATAARGLAGLEIGGLSAVTWPAGEPDSAAVAAFLASKAPAIAGGTEQMQRNGIAERVLGLPREPAYDLDVPFRDVLSRAREWGSGRAGT